MTSPYVRRRRLATELRTLREHRDLTTDELARLVHQSRTKISRLENAQLRPDLAEIMTILDALEITGSQWDKVIRLARDAAVKGWWDSIGDAMGPRQRVHADLESGAAIIRNFNQRGFPGVLQTAEFVEALIDLEREEGPLDYRPERILDARRQRQRQLLSPDGPTYEAVLDECIVYRLAVPVPVMRAQIRHLIATTSAEPRITVRVLPYNTRIEGGLLPRSSFSLFTFPDPADPPTVVVSTVTTELVYSERQEVERYTAYFDRVRKASLSPADSLAMLETIGDRLTEETGSER